ncbi:MAG: Uma2 family endonuclease [Cyanobacteria bacterium P01_G01_bin.54]
MKNFQEHPQSILLTDSLGVRLQALHPEGDYAIGQDCGIDWRSVDPPEHGAEAIDWFYVPGVPPNLGGKIRRSYVLWQELLAPYIALEFASGDGSEEKDTTPLRGDRRSKPGKFWVYEQIIRIPYYGIYIIEQQQLELYHLVNGYYQPVPTNARGHYPIQRLEIELGTWQGSYQNQQQTWMRWWDSEGNLLLTGAERADQEQQRADQEYEARQAAIPRLLAMGLPPAQVAEALDLPLSAIA